MALARRAAGTRAGGEGARAVRVPRAAGRRDPYGGMLGWRCRCWPRPAAPARPRRAVRVLGARVVPRVREPPPRATGSATSPRRARSSCGRRAIPKGSSSGSTRSPTATGSRASSTRTCCCSGVSARRCSATRATRSRTELVPGTLRKLLFTARSPARRTPDGPAPARAAAARERAARGADRSRSCASVSTRCGRAQRGDHGGDARARDRSARRAAGARAGAGERPLASALARWQIERQPEVSRCCTGWC